MNIAWVVNIPLPDIANHLGIKGLPYGGWLIRLAKHIQNEKDCELTIFFPHEKKVNGIELNGITYYSFNPNLKLNNCSVLENILKANKYDIVHLNGTEFPFMHVIQNVCKKLGIHTVVSIQGLISKISTHMQASLPFGVFYGKTLRNILRRDSVHNIQTKYYKRGLTEKRILKDANHVIGRTTFDHAVTKLYNPKVKYYHHNESLRDSFYHSEWKIDSMDQHRIFVSQANYSIKGFHYVIKALKDIVETYPNTHVYVSGSTVLSMTGYKNKYLKSRYERYLIKLLRKYHLVNNVTFIGLINEERMLNEYLKAHVYILPSTIENSSNSLSEAMLLGVPSVASYVGGTPDLLEHQLEGYLYQHDAPYMMAHFVKEIFSNDELAQKFSKNARSKALHRHDVDKNTKRLLAIYKEIIEGAK